MKSQIIASIKRIGEDRYLSILLSLFLISCIVSFIYIIVSIHPSELQVVVHYSNFGTTNFYRDRWYYLLTFAGFVVVMAILHSLVVYRLLNAKGREFALAFIYLSFIILAVAVALFYQILKVASLS